MTLKYSKNQMMIFAKELESKYVMKDDWNDIKDNINHKVKNIDRIILS